MEHNQMISGTVLYLSGFNFDIEYIKEVKNVFMDSEFSQ